MRAELDPDFANQLNMFVHKLQNQLQDLGNPQVRVSSNGRVKLRIYLEWENQNPKVYCFIRISDGALLKASSWNNVVYAEPLCSRLWDEDFGLRTCTPKGIDYFGECNP